AARLARYLRAEWRGLAAGLACALFTGPIPLGVGRMISRFFESGTVDPATGATRWDLERATLVCLGAAGLYTLLFVLRYGQGWFLARTTQRIGAALRRDVYAHLQGMSLGYFHRKRTGALMSVLTSDVLRLQGAAMLLKDGVAQPVVATCILVRLVVLSPSMTLFALVVVPLMGLAIQRISRRLRAVAKEVQDRAGELNALMEETLSAPRVVQSFGASDREVARFAAENDRVLHATMRGVKRTALLGPTVDWIGAMAVAFTLYAGSRSGIAAGTFVEFVFLSSQLANAVGALGNLRGASEEMLGAADRVFAEVLDVEPEIRDRPGAVALEEPRGRIEFRGVSFGYVLDEPVLRGIDLTVEPGSMVALVGATGAGKSTLADLVPRFHDPDVGAVLVDGQDVREVTLASLRRHIALVPQRTVLFTGTLAENIAYGRPDATDSEIEAAARAANAHDFIVSKPLGYRTPVGERGETLSGGQAQRIAIARALLADPRILILDEATSALDAATERLVQEALGRLMRGRTTLVIAHRLSTIADADRIVVLDHGCVVESGTWDELMRAGGRFAALVRAREQPETTGGA
ncbi:MAG: ABC transporter ATP-binding protein, partial [Armatimonadota bacterium]